MGPRESLRQLLRLYRRRCCDLDGNLLSQERLSDELDYGGSTYGQWERGERRPRQREDMLPLIQIFQRRGGIQTHEEANRLLVAANFAPLQPGELEMFAGAPSPQPVVSAPVEPRPEMALRADPTICQVFDKFPDKEFSDHVRQGQRIRILTTWIPLLEMFFDALIVALHAGARVEILMLHPASPAAELRSLAVTAAKSRDRVKNGVHGNLASLADVASTLPAGQQQRLQVRFYHSLPSVLLYQADTFCLAGFYFHGYMASHDPQLQVNLASGLGQTLQREFETLWAMGQRMENLADWKHELGQIAAKFTLDQRT